MYFDVFCFVLQHFSMLNIEQLRYNHQNAAKWWLNRISSMNHGCGVCLKMEYALKIDFQMGKHIVIKHNILAPTVQTNECTIVAGNTGIYLLDDVRDKYGIIWVTFPLWKAGRMMYNTLDSSRWKIIRHKMGRFFRSNMLTRRRGNIILRMRLYDFSRLLYAI